MCEEQFTQDFLSAWNSHDASRVLELYAQDYEGRDVAEAAPQHGREAIRQMVERYLQAFPDLQLVCDQVIAQDNELVMVWTARGTHRGPFMNVPATRRPVTIRGVSVLSLQAGKIRRGDHLWDVAGFLREIGLLPEL